MLFRHSDVKPIESYKLAETRKHGTLKFHPRDLPELPSSSILSGYPENRRHRWIQERS